MGAQRGGSNGIGFFHHELLALVESWQSHGQGKTQQQAKQDADAIARRDDLFMVMRIGVYVHPQSHAKAHFDSGKQDENQGDEQSPRMIEEQHGKKTVPRQPDL